MIDTNSNAARDFYKLVRDFSDRANPWNTRAVFYETQPDEVYDVSLVSERVYGRRDEVLAVMAAAGLSMCDQPLTQRKLVLPNDTTLYQIKRIAGFESISDYRSDYAPTWLT